MKAKKHSCVNVSAVKIKCDMTQQRKILHSSHRGILKSRILNYDKKHPVFYPAQAQGTSKILFNYKLTVLDIMKHIKFKTPTNTNVQCVLLSDGAHL